MLDPALLRIFLKAAQHLNFAAAAKDLGISASQVSKGITTLEQQLRKKLFLRTTRLVKLSPDGELWIPSARRALDAIRDTEEFFTEASETELSGKLRVSCSNTLGVRRLAARVAEFHCRHPKVQIECRLSDHHVDLLEEGIDAAVRIMALHDSSLVARKIADNPILFYASPDYLKRHPAVRAPADLARHPLLHLTEHASLRFARSRRELREVAGPGGLTATNGDFLVELAIAGAGILVRPAWGVERELRLGLLKPIGLKDSLESRSAIYVVFDGNRFMPKRLRAWIDFLAAEL